MNTNELKEYKKKLKLSFLQRDVLIGIMLGDGHLESLNDGRTYRLRVEQSKKNEAYVKHLYEIFKPFVLQPPKEAEKKLVDSKTSITKTHNNIFFRTVTHHCFRFYGKLFYQGKTKIVPKNIHKFLNDRVLAYWFMDDGAKKGKDRTGKRLHTEGFSKDEVHKLCKAMNDYGIQTTVQNQNRTLPSGEKKTYQILYITAEGDQVFTEKIQPYIHESMMRKF